MQYMLSVFNLRPGVTVAKLVHCVREFDCRMCAPDFIVSVGPLVRRRPDPLLDTDDRGQQFSFWEDAAVAPEA